MKKHILVISHSSGEDGAERSLIEVVECIRQYFSVTVVLPASKGYLPTQLKKMQCPYVVVSYSTWLWPKKLVRVEDKYRERRKNNAAVLRLMRIIEDQHVDLVLTNTIIAPWGAIAAAILNVPHIWWVREYGDEDHGLQFETSKEKALQDVGRLSDLVVANSKAIESHLKKYIPTTKVTLVYNKTVEDPHEYPVDTVPNIFTQDGSIKAVIVGRVTESKGQLEAIQAIQRIVSDGGLIELAIIGSLADELYVNELKRYIARHNLEKYIHLLGPVGSAAPYISQADLGIMASRREAFGRVTLEFLMHGKPVVGADNGGTSELVQHGKNGFLYQPGSDELELYLRKYYSDRDLLAIHGKNASGTVLNVRTGKDSFEKKIPLIFDNLLKNRSIASKQIPNYTIELLRAVEVADKYKNTIEKGIIKRVMFLEMQNYNLRTEIEDLNRIIGDLRVRLSEKLYKKIFKRLGLGSKND